jgi:hypothetical protein
MAAPGNTTELVFSQLYELTAGQTFTFELLGESAALYNVDEIVVLNVPAADLSKVVCYSGNWSDVIGVTGPGATGAPGATYYQGEPNVAFLPNTVLGALLDKLSAGLTGEVGATAGHATPDGLQIVDDGGSAAHTLVWQFQQAANFTYTSADSAVGGNTGAASDYLAGIPAEAIKSYNTTAIDCAPLTSVVVDVKVTPTDGDSAQVTGTDAAIMQLFEQAAQAGMVRGGTAAAGLPDLNNSAQWAEGTPAKVIEIASAAAGMPVRGAQFAPGQKLSIFVKYTPQKVRQYKLDAAANLAGTPAGLTGATGTATTVVYGGETFSVDFSEGAEVATGTSKIYQIVFNAATA